MNRTSRLNWYKSFADCAKHQQNLINHGLVIQFGVDQTSLRRLQEATACFLAASMGLDQIDSPAKFLDSIKDSDLSKLPNRTPNGAIVPKMEVTREFNELQAVTGQWFQSIGFEPIVDDILSPVTVRVVAGHADAKTEARPYATNKMHSDAWSGVPADSFNLVLMLGGDSERTQLEFCNPPEDFEEHWLKILDSYDIGHDYVKDCPRLPVVAPTGTAVFFDAVVPHRTMRKGGESRITLQTTLRRKVTPEYRQKASQEMDSGKLVHFEKFAEFVKLGREKLLTFTDTLADARNGNFREKTYEKMLYSTTVENIVR
jgi:hypothetical protein